MAPKKKTPAASGDVQSRIDEMLTKEDAQIPASTRKLGEARCSAAWARMVKALLFMLVTVQNQMVLDYLQEKGIMDDYIQ